MTPERIREAEQIGADQSKSCHYSIGSEPGTWFALATTPFSRVCGLARKAALDMKPFNFDQLPEEERTRAIEPVLEVMAVVLPPRKLTDPRPEIRRIVIAPFGTDDIAAVIQPTRDSPSVQGFSNPLGVKRETKGMTATFPLSALDQANEVVLILENGPQKRLRITEKLMAAAR